MFAMSRGDIPQAYRCRTYHRRGTKGCTSHHIRVEKLDEMLKSFILKVKNNSEDMLESLQKSIDNEKKETASSKDVVEVLMQRIINENKNKSIK